MVCSGEDFFVKLSQYLLLIVLPRWNRFWAFAGDRAILKWNERLICNRSFLVPGSLSPRQALLLLPDSPQRCLLPKLFLPPVI